LGTASSTVLVLAWGYVVSRILHAWIHLGSNYVPRRFQAFLVGFAILIALAVMLAIQLALPPSTIQP
jgi:hypothetical protein